MIKVVWFKIFHLTAHMLPLYLVKYNALFCTNYTAYRKKMSQCVHLTRPVAAKQPGSKPSRLPHLGPDAAASVQDAGP